ncbi:uncharacterized protein LOC106638560 [Copidosoma floridanum]|uniref:uncharacterized protein LOC106638560 n=1 Tax=Copidosoma floridanum TaxID=29053 RepID=UPI0006C96A19|nr:uncharacterized protein LOC106638560 [Copidosoma floridanum]
MVINYLQERIQEKTFENTGCETVQLGLDLKSEATFPRHNYIDKSTINQQELMDKYGTDVTCHGFILSTSIAVISPNHTTVQTSATHGVSSVESTVSCTTQKNHMLQQINEQPTVSDIHHSLLLKRMLQAPVGVSLSHMANHPIELGSSHSTISTKTASERDEQEVLQAIAESSGVGNAGFNIDLLLQEKPAYNFKMNNTLELEHGNVATALVTQFFHFEVATLMMYRWKGKFVTKKVYNAMLQRRQNGLDRRKERVHNSNEKAGCDETYSVDGNRIVNLQYMSKQMVCLMCKEKLLLQNIEKETQMGLASIFYVRCQSCLYVNSVKSGEEFTSPFSGNALFSINAQAALGAVHSGLGQVHLSKLCGTMNLPDMSSNTFKLHERIVGPVIKQVA